MHKKYFIDLLQYILIAFSVFLVFFKVTGFDFIYFDDSSLIQKSYSFISDTRNLPNAFLQDANITSGYYSNYYRPVQIITLIVNAQFCKLNAGCYHISNLVFHIIFTLLLFVFLKRLKINKWTALMLSLLFSVHPALVSALGWIIGGNEILLGIFFLASIIIFEIWINENKKIFLFLYVLFFNLALYTKEIALLIIPITLFYGWFYMEEFRGMKKRYLFAFWAISITLWYLLRRNAVQDFTVSMWDQVSFSYFGGLIIYIGKIFPLSLSVFPNLKDSIFLPGIITIIFLVILFIKLHKKGKEFTFGFFWFLVLLFPAITQPEARSDPLFLEHRMYLPLVGMFIVAGQLYSQELRYKKILQYGSVVLLIIFAALSLSRLNFYKNEESFWRKATTESPKSAIALVNLGSFYQFSVHEPGKAKELYEKALQLDPYVPDAHVNLGIIYFDNGDVVKANHEILEELKTHNTDYAWLHLGRIFYSENMYEKALFSWNQAYSISPTNLPVVINLALVNADLKNFTEAKKFYDLAVSQGGYDSPDREYLEKVKFLENY